MMELTKDNLQKVLVVVFNSGTTLKEHYSDLAEKTDHPIYKVQAKCQAAAHQHTLDVVGRVAEEFNISLTPE